MKKIIIITELLLISIAVVGCNKVRTTNDNGIERALSNSEYPSSLENQVVESKDYVQTNKNETFNKETVTDTTSSSTEHTNTQNNEPIVDQVNNNTIDVTTNKTKKSGVISRVIKCKDKTLNISANVYCSDIDKVSKYKYSSSTIEYQPIIDQIIGSDKSTFKRLDFDGLRYGGTVKGKDAEYQLYSGFSFTMCDVCSPYNMDLGEHTSDMAPGCSKSVSECRAIADSLINKFCPAKYTEVSTSILNQTGVNGEFTKTGYYEFTYYQYLDGLDIYDYTSGGKFAVGKVVLADNTIYEFYCSLPVYNRDGTYDVMSALEATDILESQINNFYDCTLGTITEIRLQYITSCDDYPDTLNPSWVFYDKTGGHCFIVDIITGAVREFSYNG